MKILIVSPTFFPIMGGAERGIYEIARRLAARHEVKILTPFPERAHVIGFGVEEMIKMDNIEVSNFRDRANLLRLPGYWKSKGIIPPFSLSALLNTIKIVNRFRPDIINVFYAVPSGLTAALIPKLKKVPTVLSLIGRDIPGPGVPYYWKYYVRMIMRMASSVTFISDYCRRALSLDPNFGQIIPFGVDIIRFKPGQDGKIIRKKLAIPGDANVLLSIQRLDKWKRVDILIKAMKLILESLDVYLVVGGKGPELPSLIRLSKQLQVNTRIAFVNYIKEEDLSFYYSMADAFIFHSTYETLGLVLLEAMASGKPIISVKGTAISEVVINNVNGILVEPLSPKEMANGAVSLLQDPVKMKKFGKASRQIAVERYNLDVIANRYEALFQKTVDSFVDQKKTLRKKAPLSFRRQ